MIIIIIIAVLVILALIVVALNGFHNLDDKHTKDLWYYQWYYNLKKNIKYARTKCSRMVGRPII
jgi:Mn2+/Fe2+ NRAMP family transporter